MWQTAKGNGKSNQRKSQKEETADGPAAADPWSPW